MRGGEDSSLLGREVVGERVREHALLDVQVDIASRGAGVGHEVEHGRRVAADRRARLCGRELDDGLALCRCEGIDVDERLHLCVAGRSVRDHRAPIGVADEHDRAADRAQVVAQVGGIAEQAT